VVEEDAAVEEDSVVKEVVLAGEVDLVEDVIAGDDESEEDAEKDNTIGASDEEDDTDGEDKVVEEETINEAKFKGDPIDEDEREEVVLFDQLVPRLQSEHVINSDRESTYSIQGMKSSKNQPAPAR
jgi:hypothetical protein